jgi:hypothetical protein
MPNSIDTLSPNNRFVRILNTLPFAKGIPINTSLAIAAAAILQTAAIEW